MLIAILKIFLMRKIVRSLVISFLSVCFLSLCIQANAQEKQVTGKVTSQESGEPLAGVTVTEKGTKKAVITDGQGNYRISVNNNAALVFTYAGYLPHEVAVGDQTIINASLALQIKSQDEVVVIGYQSVRRKDLTGSVSSVNAKQLKDIPINSAAEALAGRLAGVQVTGTEGSPDADVLIRVRGGGSITQDISPIYIVDGVQVENALSVLSPQDIESIDVLKDASTTAIYGARGANGVVIITTKGGRNVKPTISYNGLVGIQKLANKLQVMSPYEFVLYQYERSRGSSADAQTFQDTYGRWEDLDLYNSVPAVDWQEEMFGRPALMQTHNVTLNGGDAKTQYNLSLTYNKQDAIMERSDFDRKLANFRFDHTFSSKLKVGFSTRYNNTVVDGAGTSDPGSSSNNNLRQSIKYKPILTPGQSEYDYDPDYSDQTNQNSLRLVNPLLLNQAQYRRKISDILNLTGYVNLTINKYLSFRTTLGYDLTNTEQRAFDDTITSNSKQNSAGMPLASINKISQSTVDNSNVLTFTMNASGTGFSQNNKLTVLLGQETFEEKGKNLYVQTKYFPIGISPERAFAEMNLGSGPQGQPQPPPTSVEFDRKLSSFFGRIDYSYADRYLLNLSFRADGSTQFIPGKQWGYFPSGTFAWRISREKFMEGISSVISDLKLRIGYGESGNNRIGDFLYLTTFDAGTQYDLLDQLISAYRSTSLANSTLQWETNISRNIGLDISFLRNRIQFTADVYQNSSKNLLLNVAVPSSSGYTTQIQNVGSLTNSGVEFQIDAVPIQKKNFTWTANFNASFNKNRIKSLGPDQTSFLVTSGWAGSNVPSDFIVKVGESVGAVWGLTTDGWYTLDDFDYDATAGTYTLKTGVPNDQSILATAPQPGMLKFKDLNGDGVIDDDDRAIIGNTLPKIVGGFNNQFTYKNFDLSIFLNFQFGNKVYNANKLEFSSGYTVNSNLLTIMNSDKRWRTVDAQGNVVTDPDALRKLNAAATIWRPITSAGSFYTHSWAIEDGGFVRLNNITIGYTLPKSLTAKAKIQSLRIYVTGNNLKVFTNYSGYDPEVDTRHSTHVTPSVDYSAFPRSRSFIFGVNLTF
jgi:TonB-linked SusC/RagA family outer membrane protein